MKARTHSLTWSKSDVSAVDTWMNEQQQCNKYTAKYWTKHFVLILYFTANTFNLNFCILHTLHFQLHTLFISLFVLLFDQVIRWFHMRDKLSRTSTGRKTEWIRSNVSVLFFTFFFKSRECNRNMWHLQMKKNVQVQSCILFFMYVISVVQCRWVNECHLIPAPMAQLKWRNHR